MIAPFVDQAWLSDHPGVVIADVRWGLGVGAKRDDYARGHLPRAVFVDLDRDLASHGLDPALAGRHPLPEPEAFAAAMARLGIGDDDTVIAYDDDSGAIAARLVWMLRATGHDAAVLDGGLAAWPGQLEPGEVHRTPATFTARPWPTDRLATIADLDGASGTVLDARAADRFAGAADGVDPRPGHIPGSRNLPCRGHVSTDGRLLPDDELRTRFAAVGIADADTPLIASCGSGVAACLNLLVAEHLGLGPARLFPGSWSQYSRDDAWPVETGPDPAAL